MADGSLALRVQGLGDLRRVLRKANRDLDYGVTGGMRETAKSVRARARANAPEGPARDPHRGDLKRSLRYSVTTRRASVYSNLVYAPVHEWGGTIRPRGAPIEIPRRRFVGRAVAESRRDIEAWSVGLLDEIARTFDVRTGG